MSARHRWVTFDCFGTLIDWRSWFAEVLGPLAAGRPELESAYLAQERTLERQRPFQPYREVVATALTRAASELAIALSPSDAKSLTHAWGSMRPFADVEAMLSQLRERGWRIGVLANCDDDLFERTHRRFGTPFDLFVTSERVRAYKPARWHFRAFELITSVRRDEWVHVGSNWYQDVAPARELGIQHIWLDRKRADGVGGPRASRVQSGAAVVAAIDELFDADWRPMPSVVSP